MIVVKTHKPCFRAPLVTMIGPKRRQTIESTDATEPTEPIDKIEPAEPIDKMDPAEPIDRIDPLEPMLRMDPSVFRMRSFSQGTNVPARHDGHPCQRPIDITDEKLKLAGGLGADIVAGLSACRA